MVAVRKRRKMSLLTELEILGDGFLQRCRAYGALETGRGVFCHLQLMASSHEINEKAQYKSIDDEIHNGIQNAVGCFDNRRELFENFI